MLMLPSATSRTTMARNGQMMRSSRLLFGTSRAKPRRSVIARSTRADPGGKSLRQVTYGLRGGSVCLAPLGDCVAQACDGALLRRCQAVMLEACDALYRV